MEIQKRAVLTSVGVKETIVIIKFERFEPVPLHMEKSEYAGILTPVVEELFGKGFEPLLTPSSIPAKSTHQRVIPHQEMGFPRKCSWSLPEPSVVTHSGYFLFFQEELATPFDRFGQHIGLLMRNQIILSPPLFNRPALYITPKGIGIKKTSIKDLTLILPNGLAVGCNGNTKNPRSSLLCFGNDTLESSIQVLESERLLVISGTTVVEDKLEGKAWVPRTGIVVRLAGEDRHPLHQNFEGLGVVYKLHGFSECSHAIQCGPLLVQKGNLVDLNQELTDEKFVVEQNVRLPPSRFPIDVNLTRAARFAIGIDPNDRVLAVLVEGKSSRGRIGVKSKKGGMNLLELAELMKNLGLEKAMNFDGGGSVQAFLQGGGSLIKPADQHQSEIAHFDRPVPFGLVLS